MILFESIFDLSNNSGGADRTKLVTEEEEEEEDIRPNLTCNQKHYAPTSFCLDAIGQNH